MKEDSGLYSDKVGDGGLLETSGSSYATEGNPPPMRLVGLLEKMRPWIFQQV
jgi:hypothetical protein